MLAVKLISLLHGTTQLTTNLWPV